jgi:hypothetical protein
MIYYRPTVAECRNEAMVVRESDRAEKYRSRGFLAIAE